MEKKNINTELVSLNDELYDDFYVQELEERLETDPLIAGGLIEMTDDATTTCTLCVVDIDCLQCEGLCITDWF